jgi:3-oxoacyl-(acyl-carrier-protein) synthase
MTATTGNGLRSVVVTGAALATPAGYSLLENVTAWREGKHAFSEITRFNTAGSSVRYAGECPAPDIKKLPDRKVQKILRRKDVISLLTTLAVAESAKLEKGKVDPERCGMYVGAPATQIGDLTPYFMLVAQCVDLESWTFDSAKFGQQLMEIVNPLVVLQTLMNNGLCFGSMTLDLRGVNANFMDFQVAGLRAVGEAFRSVAYGRAEVVVAGGISGPIEPFQLAEGVHSGYLAKTRELAEPIGAVVKPYDRRRSGAILSEGAAYVVLEEEQHALARGVPILARVRGFHLTSDGTFDVLSGRESPGLGRSMRGALADGGLGVDDLALVVGHGNGSTHADAAEARAYGEVLGAAALRVPITSPKAVLGDLCEAGGVAGMILAMDALQRREAPPTYNFAEGDEYSAKLAIRAEPQPVRGRHALISTRNFLGLCASLVIEAA